MSKIFVISNLFIGDKSIANNRRFPKIEDYHFIVKHNWNKTVSENDTVFILGNSAFNDNSLKFFSTVSGKKILFLGEQENQLNIKKILSVFDDIKSKEILDNKYVLSAFPIHHSELKGKRNIYGSRNVKKINNKNYCNIKTENIGYTPMLLEDIESFFEDDRKLPLIQYHSLI